MKIYRVEHMSLTNDEGHPIGPYHEDSWAEVDHPGVMAWECDDPDCIHYYIDCLSMDASAHRPTPSKDNLPSIASTERFGFVSQSQVLNWFWDDIERLDELGYILATYMVPDSHARHGWRQSVMDSDKAIRTSEEYSLISLKG